MGRNTNFLLNFPPNNAFVSAQVWSWRTSWVEDVDVRGVLKENTNTSYLG